MTPKLVVLKLFENVMEKVTLALVPGRVVTILEMPLATIGATTSYADQGLQNGISYQYQVSAVNSVGEHRRRPFRSLR